MNEQEMAASIRRLAGPGGRDAELPDPARIWWEAELLARQDMRARAARQLRIVEWASLVASAAAGGALLIGNWPVMHDVLLRSANFAPWACSGVVLMALALRLVFGE